MTLIYEVETSVKDKSIEEKFAQYMSTKHVADVLHTGCFLSASFTKIDSSGKYRASYSAKNQADLNVYLQEYAPKLRAEFMNMFPNNEIELSRNTYQCLYLDFKNKEKI